MRLPVRPLLALALVVVAVAATAPVAAAADPAMEAGESEIVRLLNAERARYGLVRLRVDPRLTTIARVRSADMARYHYFGHVHSDGRGVVDFLNQARIAYYGAGEIIAWTGSGTYSESARRSVEIWMASTVHRNMILSRDVNYFGLGLAVDASNGKRLWTGVFIKGPDRTGGWATFRPAPRIAIPAGSRYQTVTFAWTGGDVQLQTLTAGFSHFRLRVRTDGGPWSTTSTTASTSRQLRVWRGHRYEVIVSACDRAANCGRWDTLRLQG